MLCRVAMKTIALFAALMLVGWTLVAGGVIAMFAAEPAVSSRAHTHELELDAPTLRAPMYSGDDPCLGSAAGLDAAVPCPA